ncbi:DUF7305 domain-containing protein [Pyxidicoccus xibeiensis]|uniref:DUF7305 domain-containing protein n=1 Tax=Pyxidicoccus xibeiensis TaxID=2906759 RepID=UPI0020A6DFA7|nr:hypothetical protein [Pyxidicoccus xibeiensis]MCP3142578.1 hypothetical protein [Pyxidicoccus xibeiensis]
MKRHWRFSLLLASTTVSAGCTQSDLVATIRSPDGGLEAPPADAGPPDGGEPGDGGIPPDAGIPPDSGVPPDWTAYCAGRGPPIVVGDTRVGVCSGVLAERTFRKALCTCERLALSASLETDAFRGSMAPYQPGGAGGDVGVNGSLSANDSVSVGGTLQVGGDGGIQLGRPLTVGGALYSGGPLNGSTVSATVTGAASVRGDVALASLTVGGSLTVPPEYTLGPVQAAEVLRGPVDAVTPCACEAASQVDVAALVAHHSRDNDNAAISLGAAAMEGITGERTLELPCGRFHLTRITGTGRATLVIRARTALFIGDVVDLGEGLTVDVQPPGELDLFIGGSVAVAGPLTLGSVDVPSRTRVYVAGSSMLALSAGSLLAGNVYAPGSLLSLSGNAEVFGSVFVRHLESSGALRLHYDADVLDAGVECPGN